MEFLGITLLILFAIASGLAVALRQRSNRLPPEEAGDRADSTEPPTGADESRPARVPVVEPTPNQGAMRAASSGAPVVVQTRGGATKTAPERPPATWVEGVLVVEGISLNACLESLPTLDRRSRSARHLEAWLLLEACADGTVWIRFCDGLPMADAFRLLSDLGGADGQLQLAGDHPGLGWLKGGGHARLQGAEGVWDVALADGVIAAVEGVAPGRREQAEVVQRAAKWVDVDTREQWVGSALRELLAARERPRVWRCESVEELLYQPEDHGFPPLAELEAYYEGACVFASTDEQTSWLFRMPDGVWLAGDRECYLRRFLHFTGPALDRLRWAYEVCEQDGEALVETAKALGLPRPKACAGALEAGADPQTTFDVQRLRHEREVWAWFVADGG